ncbi:hypothetical protein BDR26DRAFT_864327 [Obelidium mucronatum]|nr:hypothetical protein BDR26DRAFT_864327 [Obelidium mucronatum]
MSFVIIVIIAIMVSVLSLLGRLRLWRVPIRWLLGTSWFWLFGFSNRWLGRWRWRFSITNSPQGFNLTSRNNLPWSTFCAGGNHEIHSYNAFIFRWRFPHYCEWRLDVLQRACMGDCAFRSFVLDIEGCTCTCCLCTKPVRGDALERANVGCGSGC